MRHFIHLALAALLLTGVAACNPQLGQHPPVALPHGDAEQERATFITRDDDLGVDQAAVSLSRVHLLM